MTSSRGFLVGTILIVVVIGLGFGGYKLVENYRQTQQLVAAQQQNLIAAQQEIKSLAASASSSAAATQKEIAQTQAMGQNTQSQNTIVQSNNNEASIDASEIAPYENGVMQASCGGGVDGVVYGSASLWNLPSFGYVALTNFHVIQDGLANMSQNPNAGCSLYPGFQTTGSVPIVSTAPYAQYETFNSIADEAILPITSVFSIPANGGTVQQNVPVDSLDYKISSLPRCAAQMPLDAPVVVLGFPAYATQEVPSGIPGYGEASQSALIVSNGIISGYDSTSVDVSGLPYVNYYVSAKIDSGNSGGIAFSKDAQGLCVLGIPTWVSTGNYENEGVVQNILNVMYQS